MTVSMGAKWRVGDGLSISVFKDNWIPDASGGRVTASVTGVDANMKVADLIDASFGCWKNHLIDSCLLPFDATRIKAIPLSDLPQSDLMYWALERSGIYSVKNLGTMLYVMKQGVGKHQVQIRGWYLDFGRIYGSWGCRGKLNIFFGELVQIACRRKLIW